LTHATRIFRCVPCRLVFEACDDNGEVRCPDCYRPIREPLAENWSDKIPDKDDD